MKIRDENKSFDDKLVVAFNGSFLADENSTRQELQNAADLLTP